MSLAPHSMVFAGAAHLDWIGRFARPATGGQSVPGSWMAMAGGAALNIASNVAAAQVPVTLYTAVGQDSGAARLKHDCTARGVNFKPQVITGQTTANYTAMVNPDGSLVQALADMAVYEAFDAAAVECPPNGWMIADANLPVEALRILYAMEGVGKRVALSVSATKAVRLVGVLPQLDLLFTNTSELRILLNETGAQDASDLGVKTVIVSDGPGDVEIWDGGQHHTVRPPALPSSEIVSVIGGGDGLAAGTLVGLWRGLPVTDAVRLGLKIAQEVLHWPGPWADTLPQMLTPPPTP